MQEEVADGVEFGHVLRRALVGDICAQMEQQRDLDVVSCDLVGSRNEPEAAPVVKPRAIMGRPTVFFPNDDDRWKVRCWARVGTPQAVIARELGMSEDTLRKLYADELAEAMERGIGEVAATLFQKAIMGDNAAMIFFLKTRARWVESGIGDAENPIHLNASVDVSALAQQMRNARVVEGKASSIEDKSK